MGIAMQEKQTFIQLSRSKDTMELIKEQDAFILLSVIALRARRTDAFNIYNLKPREALIGDHNNYGMTQQRYRTAKSKLEKWGFITTTATSKGTIATLLDNGIYDINLESGNEQSNKPPTIKQRASNEQATTNNNVNNDNNENNGIIFTLKQVEDEGFKAGISDGECKIFFDHYCSQGWLKGNGLPITNLASQLANWRNNGHKFPDKPKPPPDLKKSQHDQWESQCGGWLRQSNKDTMANHASFMQRLNNPDFRTWAESVNVIVKEI